MDGWLVSCFQGKSDAPSDVATAAIILMLASDIYDTTNSYLKLQTIIIIIIHHSFIHSSAELTGIDYHDGFLGAAALRAATLDASQYVHSR